MTANGQCDELFAKIFNRTALVPVMLVVGAIISVVVAIRYYARRAHR